MRVKKLNWQHRGGRRDDWFADCPVGQYCAAEIHGVPKAIIRSIRDGEWFDAVIGNYASVENARAGAQRHFDRTVLNLIETTT